MLVTQANDEESRGAMARGDFEADQPVVGLRRQQALIKAVLGATSADETRWLEWTSDLDVSKPEGAFSVARAILGFANRMPDVAARWAGGHAYLLVGVEEGALHGVTTHDVEKVDPWIGRYLGEDFDRYTFTYVPLDIGEGTRHVMFVDVFPPQWGDPIHPLRKAHDKAYAGTVFHRYPGRTQPAAPGEIDALTGRARRAAQRIDVAVEMNGGALAVVPFNQDTIKQSLTETRDKLLGQLSAPGEDDSSVNTWALQSLALSDYRTEDDFREEVEEYVHERVAATEEFLLRATGKAGTPLRVQLTNPGETFLAEVALVLTLTAPVRAHVWDEDDEIRWPQKPDAYGTRALPGSWPLMQRPPVFIGRDDPRPQVEQEGDQLVVRYRPLDLRPHETLRLHPVLLYSYAETTDTAARWSATATNVSGHKQGSFVIPVERVQGPNIEKAAELLRD
ncbi:hypothetical protein ACFY04_41055 [Streptomyces sp. NPDC001549]|uniref:hypothetical protein n=1 Tax=Streptomyces sp. NPDC001549 TaxID=3364586 RepID=UPI0036B00C70